MNQADEQKFLANEGEQILAFENELLGCKSRNILAAACANKHLA